MIPNNLLDIKTEGNISGEHISMTIDEDSLQHIMSVLTDLYSDTAMACIREYSTNARDAQIEAGHDGPIDITLPSMMLPVFKVRDYGKGLSLDDIRNVYSKYGASTKRESNGFNGMLGLGAKSALTYTSSFTVASVNGGYRHVVEVGRDEDGGGYMNIVDSFPSDEPSGVEVQIPVASANIGSFVNKINSFFEWWDEGTFRINGQDNTPNRRRTLTSLDYSDKVFIDLTANGSWYNGNARGGDRFIMGGVSYPSPFENILHVGGVVYFAEIGELTFSPSRESLLTNSSNLAVRDKIAEGLRSNVIAQVSKEIDKCKTLASAYHAWSNYSDSLIHPILGSNAANIIKHNGESLTNFSDLFSPFSKAGDPNMWIKHSTVRGGTHSQFHRLGGTTSRSTWGVDKIITGMSGASIIVHSAPDSSKNASGTLTADRGLTHLGHNDKGYIMTNLESDDPYVKPIIEAFGSDVIVMDWSDIRKASREYLALNRTNGQVHKTPKAVKKADEFDVMDGLTWSYRISTVIDTVPSDGAGVVYLNRGFPNSKSSFLWGDSQEERARAVNNLRASSGMKFVIIPVSDHEAFKKAHPKAIHYNDLVRHIYGPEAFVKLKDAIEKRFSRSFTDDEIYGAIRNKDENNLDWPTSRAFDCIKAVHNYGGVDDPRFAEVVDAASAASKYLNVIDQNTPRGLAERRIFEKYVEDEIAKADKADQTVPVIIGEMKRDYPLLGVSDNVRHPKELALYINVVYAKSIDKAN